MSSVAQSCPTLCDPMNCSTPGLPVHNQLPEFTQLQWHLGVSVGPLVFWHSRCSRFAFSACAPRVALPAVGRAVPLPCCAPHVGVWACLVWPLVVNRGVSDSSHLILCRPLLLLPPIPPSIRVFSNESTLCMRWPKYWSFSFSIIPSKEPDFSNLDILKTDNSYISRMVMDMGLGRGVGG